MEPLPNLLIVDDDREIRDLLTRFLHKHGFRVTAVKDGQEMTRKLTEGRFDLIVLDLMLPGEDGLAICRRLRTESAIPIIMLTAMGEDIDRIVGLEMGADDYLPKPFNPRELMARIRSILRRAQLAQEQAKPASGRKRFAGFVLNVAERHLSDSEGQTVPLSSGEYDLLLAFIERPRRVLSRDQLLDLAKGRTAIPFDRSIDVQVSRLRKRLGDDPKEPALIKTVRGGGYMFCAEVEDAS